MRREEQLFNYALYCATDEGQVRNTFFEATGATPPSSSSPLSSTNEPVWLDNSVTVARYSELMDKSKPYLVIWKKRPHHVKIKLHCKMNISKTVKFYYETTVRDILKYLASYLTDEENPAQFGLQENLSQFQSRIARLQCQAKGLALLLPHSV